MFCPSRGSICYRGDINMNTYVHTNIYTNMHLDIDISHYSPTPAHREVKGSSKHCST